MKLLKTVILLLLILGIFGGGGYFAWVVLYKPVQPTQTERGHAAARSAHSAARSRRAATGQGTGAQTAEEAGRGARTARGDRGQLSCLAQQRGSPPVARRIQRQPGPLHPVVRRQDRLHGQGRRFARQDRPPVQDQQRAGHALEQSGQHHHPARPAPGHTPAGIFPRDPAGEQEDRPAEQGQVLQTVFGQGLRHPRRDRPHEQDEDPRGREGGLARWQARDLRLEGCRQRALDRAGPGRLRHLPRDHRRLSRRRGGQAPHRPRARSGGTGGTPHAGQSRHRGHDCAVTD